MRVNILDTRALSGGLLEPLELPVVRAAQRVGPPATTGRRGPSQAAPQPLPRALRLHAGDSARDEDGEVLLDAARTQLSIATCDPHPEGAISLQPPILPDKGSSLG